MIMVYVLIHENVKTVPVLRSQVIQNDVRRTHYAKPLTRRNVLPAATVQVVHHVNVLRAQNPLEMIYCNVVLVTDDDWK